MMKPKMNGHRSPAVLSPQRTLRPLLAHLLASAPLGVPGSLLAQAGPQPSESGLERMVSLLTLVALGFLVWQWQQQHRELRDARRVLYRLLEVGGHPPAGGTEDGEARTSQSISRIIEPSVQRLQLAIGEQAAVLDTLQESLTQAITRLEELRQDEQLTSVRVAELRANLPDGGGAGLARLVQRFHKENSGQFERLLTSQAQLASDVDTLKDHHKRDVHLLRELSGQVADLHSRMAEISTLDRANDRTEIETLEPPGLRSSLISRLELLSQQLQGQEALLKRQEKSLEGWQQQLFGLRHLVENHSRLLQSQSATFMTPEALSSALHGSFETLLRELARIEAPARAFRQLAERMEQVWNALEPLARLDSHFSAVDQPLQVLPDQLEQLLSRLEQLPEAFAHINQQLEALPGILKSFEGRLEQIEPLNATAEPLDLKSLDLRFLEQRGAEAAARAGGQGSSSNPGDPASLSPGAMPQLWEKFFEQQAQILESLRASVVQTLTPLEERLVEKLRQSLSSALEAGMGAPSLKAELLALRRSVEGIEVRDRLPEVIARLDSKVEGLSRLESRTSDLLVQVSGLQREVGLVLNARPVHSSGRAHNPFDANLALEYYNNLQKLVRVLMRNEKASTYALEALQYLYESLQLQASLTALLSSSEFAIRLTPGTLDEAIVRPVAQRLQLLVARAAGEASTSLPLSAVQTSPGSSLHASSAPSPATTAPSAPAAPGASSASAAPAAKDVLVPILAAGTIRAPGSVSATTTASGGAAAQSSTPAAGASSPAGVVGTSLRVGARATDAAPRPSASSESGTSRRPAPPPKANPARTADPVADALINGTPAFTEATHSTELPTYSELDLRGPVPVTLDARSFLDDSSLPDVEISDASLPIQIPDRRKG